MDGESEPGSGGMFWIGLVFVVLMLYADKSVRDECAAARERAFYSGTQDADEACYLADPY